MSDSDESTSPRSGTGGGNEIRRAIRPASYSSSASNSSSTSRRLQISHAHLLRTIRELSPLWQPWRMSSHARQSWYRIGNETFHESEASNSSDWMRIGQRFENRKKYQEAASAYSRSIQLNPHCSKYYYRLGCVQCELKEWYGAIESFHIAIAIAPEFVRANYYFNLAYAHSEIHEWQEAIQALKIAIQLKPRKHLYHNLIAVCYRHANEYDLSIYHYNYAIALDRIQSAYRRNLAYVYMQLKQWSRAVRAWSGAIEFAPARALPEFYRNRAFAQAERGLLNAACDDMQRAYNLYTSTQQRKRCREKLERWRSRLQGTEQAYIRDQASLNAGSERGGGGGGGGGGEDGGSDGEEEKTNDGDGEDDDTSNDASSRGLSQKRQSSYLKRRANIRQLAGLIQGEWEQWHGEDYDASGASEEEENWIDVHPERRKVLIQQKQKNSRQALMEANNGSSGHSGKHHHSSSSQQNLDPDGDKVFLSTASSTQIRNMIKQHASRMRRYDDEDGDDADGEGEDEKEHHSHEERHGEEQKTTDKSSKSQPKSKLSWHVELVPLANGSGGDGGGSGGGSCSEGEGDDSDVGGNDPTHLSIPGSSGSSKRPPSLSIPQHTNTIHMPSPASPTSGGNAGSPSSASAAPSSSSSYHHSPLHPALLSDPTSSDLYSDDTRDIYSSLAKLFIRLRIDSKYLWRFESSGIHLHNIHTVSDEELKLILPTLGPRLTLMNFLQDRIVKVREYDANQAMLREQQNGGGAGAAGKASDSTTTTPKSGKESLSASSTLTLQGLSPRHRRRLSQLNPGTGSGGSLSPTGARTYELNWLAMQQDPNSSTGGSTMFNNTKQPRLTQDELHQMYLQQEIATIQNSLQQIRRSSKKKPPLPPPTVNPRPIQPCTPHNGVNVNRPLSAKDRRVLYDSRSNVRSAKSPIRTVGSMNWKA